MKDGMARITLQAVAGGDREGSAGCAAATAVGLSEL